MEFCEFLIRPPRRGRQTWRYTQGLREGSDDREIRLESAGSATVECGLSVLD